jgi:hypothetical protein
MASGSDVFANPRVEAVRRFLARYQPFIVTITAIALIAILLPGRNTSSGPDETATQVSTDTGADLPPDIGAEGDVAAGTKDTASDPSVGAAAPRPVDTQVLTADQAKARGVQLVANCDASTKKVMLPLRDAPPCTQRFSGTNAGASWQGVDAKKIKVVYFMGTENPATDAILTAAGANDSDEEVKQQVIEWGKLYEAHLNTWGRKVEWAFVKSSAPASAPDDDAAARADAIKVTGMKPFASINAPANIYVDELKAKGILCMCTVSLPIETYIKWYPYVWTTLMASTQGYIHRAQYTGGRLAGRNAQWAYDEIDGAIGQNFKNAKRKFGFLYYDTDAKAYKSGADFFIRHMKDKYGITFCKDCVSEYHGFPQVQRTQEESPGIIQRMKAAGVTSIICSCDPFGPIFFTKDAQQQLYGPEWIVTGSALTDTSFFARLYNQNQWSHAFGISYLSARLPEEFSGSYRLYRWQYNREPTARAGYGVINAPISILYYGIHMAGSKLTPTAFASGLENLGIQNRGGITTIAYSFGDQGLWQWKIDPAAADDATEVWWDRQAEGEDEIGQDGTGLYRYVLGGKRYMPGEWPKTNPSAFVTAKTVTIYDKPPPQDAWPCYTSPATKKKDRC